MPWYQTAGIIITAIVTLLGLPLTVADLTKTARLTNQVEKSLRIADSLPDGSTKDALRVRACKDAEKLVTMREVPYSPREALLFYVTFAVVFLPFILMGALLINKSLTATFVGAIAVGSVINILILRRRVRTDRERFVRQGMPPDFEREVSLVATAGREYLFPSLRTPTVSQQRARNRDIKQRGYERERNYAARKAESGHSAPPGNAG